MLLSLFPYLCPFLQETLAQHPQGCPSAGPGSRTVEAEDEVGGMGAQTGGDGHQLVFWKSGAPRSRGGGPDASPSPTTPQGTPPPCPSASHLQTTLNSQTCLQSQTAGESGHVTSPGPDPPHPGSAVPRPLSSLSWWDQSLLPTVLQRPCFEYQGLQRSKKQAKYFGNTECAN